MFLSSADFSSKQTFTNSSFRNTIRTWADPEGGGDGVGTRDPDPPPLINHKNIKHRVS